MNKVFNDSNETTGKLPSFARLLLIISLAVFFIPLFVLPFFNHPGADDYMCAIHLRKYGFAGYQSYIYKFWGGRYTATFIGALYASNGFLYNHYSLHSLLLIVLNILSSVFVLNALNTYILKESFIKKNLLLFSLIFTALEITVLAQPSTYIFWFSSAVTYQLPVILIQCQIGLWVLLVHTKRNTTRSFVYVLIPSLIVIINGFNELFVAAEFFMIAFVFIFLKQHKQLSKIFTWLIVTIYVASALIVLLSPGIQSRATNVLPKGLAIGTLVWCYHIAEAGWNIFRQPLFWLTALTMFFAGNYYRQKNSSTFLLKANQRKWLLLFFIALFVGITVAIPVAGLKGGIIPGRYLNAVIEIIVPLLMIHFFIAGTAIKENISLFFIKAKWQITILFCVMLLANSYIAEAYRNLISAPLYNNIMNEREATLKSASAAKDVAHINSYNTALEEHLQSRYSRSTQTWLMLIKERPSFIFFQDDLDLEKNYPTLKEFYQVDSIIVK